MIVKPVNLEIPFAGSFTVKASHGSVSLSKSINFKISRLSKPPEPFFVTELAPMFASAPEDQAITVDQEFELEGGSLSLVSSGDELSISLPEIIAPSNDLSKVTVTATSDPEADFISASTSELLVDLSAFSISEFLSDESALIEEATSVSSFEGTESVVFSLTVILEEEGNSKSTETSFSITIASKFTIFNLGYKDGANESESSKEESLSEVAGSAAGESLEEEEVELSEEETA
mmetsp:Transcript_26728/g.40758  ORF Transcript_26728/g.40758 Transcript_26728/m.40758 type:complete len:234 (-) Transcript_26728:2491-3192(-)